MLETVPRQGKRKETTEQVSLRLSSALLVQLRELAARGDRSLNAQIERMLRAAVERDDRDVNG